MSDKLPHPYKDKHLLPSRIPWGVIGGIVLWVGILALIAAVLAVVNHVGVG